MFEAGHVPFASLVKFAVASGVGTHGVFYVGRAANGFAVSGGEIGAVMDQFVP
jgi:dihydrodipicolinate synthase/N-acetylneuraminate lyase